MIRIRGPVALLLSAAVLLALAACSPFGDDDDDVDTPDGPRPTSTIQVVMSTFTPTEVVPPDQQTATEAAQQTAIENAQATRGSLPTPTPFGTVLPEEDLLAPPRTRLETSAALVESYLSTYSWQFSDAELTYASIEAPVTPLDQGEPATVENGDQLAIRYYGDEYRTPPLQLEVAVYDFESNNAIPIGPTGEQGDEPGFAIKVDPIQNLRVDPAAPTFTLEGFAPGHYIIWAQGRWGQHPQLERQIFVTWVFDIEITG